MQQVTAIPLLELSEWKSFLSSSISLPLFFHRLFDCFFEREMCFHLMNYSGYRVEKQLLGNVSLIFEILRKTKLPQKQQIDSDKIILPIQRVSFPRFRYPSVSLVNRTMTVTATTNSSARRIQINVPSYLLLPLYFCVLYLKHPVSPWFRGKSSEGAYSKKFTVRYLSSRGTVLQRRARWSSELRDALRCLLVGHVFSCKNCSRSGTWSQRDAPTLG